MDFSSANTGLWNPIVQMGIIAGLILLANTLRQKIPFIRNSLMPTAVLAGFILLVLRTFNIIHVNPSYLESITYHAIALGFIALSLRRPEQRLTGGIAIIPAALHQLVQLLGVWLVHQLPLGCTGQGNDGIPIRNRRHMAGVGADGFADLRSKIL